MLSVEQYHIIDLYCVVDDRFRTPEKRKVGRPSCLTKSELVTLLVWNVLTVHSKTAKDIYRWTLLYHRKDFPKLPHYTKFIEQCHDVAPLLLELLEELLASGEPLRFMDSTMVPVCKLVRADSHKVAKNIAQFGKNHQGWHYGFKLHISVDKQGRLCGFLLTPANVHDAQAMRRILNEHTRVAVGDGGYTARVMRELVWEHFGSIIVSPPHPKQNKKVMTAWQHKLLL